MGVIKNNSSYILKLFINHFVSGIYSLVLFIVFTIAFEGKYQFLGSILATMFYLFLVSATSKIKEPHTVTLYLVKNLLIIFLISPIIYNDPLANIISFSLAFFSASK